MPADQRKRVFAWAMWDPGTQPFASVITTFVFAVYLVGDAFGSKDRTVTALSWTMTLAGLTIALLAPVVGQWAGRRGRQVTALKWLTWTLAVMSGLLFFVKPHPSYLVFGLVLLGIGTVISDVGSSLYNGMLDDVAESGKVGRISGLGWGMGYLGGIIALLVIYIAWIKPKVGWFGVTNHEGMNIRVAMLFCAVWILALTLPTFCVLRDNPRPIESSEPRPHGLRALGHSYAELWRSVVRIWHVSRNTIIFLIASALFRDGLNGVFQFGGPLARQTFGFSASGVLIFGIVANLIAGISTILLGRLDDRIGPKRLIIFFTDRVVSVRYGCFHRPRWFCHGVLGARPHHVWFRRTGSVRVAEPPHSDLPARVPGRGLRSLRDHWQSRLVPGTGTIWPLCHGGPCHHRW